MSKREISFEKYCQNFMETFGFHYVSNETRCKNINNILSALGTTAALLERESSELGEYMTETPSMDELYAFHLLCKEVNPDLLRPETIISAQTCIEKLKNNPEFLNYVKNICPAKVILEQLKREFFKDASYATEIYRAKKKEDDQAIRSGLEEQMEIVIDKLNDSGFEDIDDYIHTAMRSFGVPKADSDILKAIPLVSLDTKLNFLSHHGINTLYDLSLTTQKQLLGFRNVGQTRLKSVLETAKHFSIKIPEDTPIKENPRDYNGRFAFNYITMTQDYSREFPKCDNYDLLQFCSTHNIKTDDDLLQYCNEHSSHSLLDSEPIIIQITVKDFLQNKLKYHREEPENVIEDEEEYE